MYWEEIAGCRRGWSWSNEAGEEEEGDVVGSEGHWSSEWMDIRARVLEMSKR